jgi:predicted small metal-binding protein
MYRAHYCNVRLDDAVGAEEEKVAKIIKCVCGFVIRGESDEELLSDAEAHIAEMHPELVGTVTREDLLAMAELVA